MATCHTVVAEMLYTPWTISRIGSVLAVNRKNDQLYSRIPLDIIGFDRYQWTGNGEQGIWLT